MSHQRNDDQTQQNHDANYDLADRFFLPFHSVHRLSLLRKLDAHNAIRQN